MRWKWQTQPLHLVQSCAAPSLLCAAGVTAQGQHHDGPSTPGPHVLGTKGAAVLCPGLHAEGWGWGHPALSSPLPCGSLFSQGQAEGSDVLCYQHWAAPQPPRSPAVWLYDILYTTNPVPTVASSCKHFKPVTFILKTNKYQ